MSINVKNISVVEIDRWNVADVCHELSLNLQETNELLGKSIKKDQRLYVEIRDTAPKIPFFWTRQEVLSHAH